MNRSPRLAALSIIAATTMSSLATVSASTPPAASGAASAVAVVVRGGTEQIEILGAPPAAAVTYAVGATAPAKPAGTTDAQGALLLRDIAPGAGYVVTVGDTEHRVNVRSRTEHPPADFYAAQTIAAGFGYITARDGTTLSANVVLPGPLDGGPYPTVIEYNGYSPSDPAGAAFAQVYTSMGFAYVGVNMRGTGCSGSSFELFGTNNALDGYDVVEAVDAQPWSAGVGLVGISYGGISQLFVAATRPPHLRAITPLSVYDNAFSSVSYPGGLLNTGFAENWMSERYEQSKPFGQAWTKARADQGDTICAANQQARLQQLDIVAMNRQEPYFPGAAGTGAQLVTAELVDDIQVPVFLAGAWQDEQTGSHFATMLDRFTGAPDLFVDLTNGGHTDPLNGTTLARYGEFLNLYVADRVPDIAGLGLISTILGATLYGTGDTAVFTNRFAGKTLDQAKTEFAAEPAVRVLVESGAAAGRTPGAALPNTVLTFPAWPIPTAVTTRWLLADGGRLISNGTATGTSSYTATPGALPATFYEGDGNGVWKADAKLDWKALPAGTGVGFVSEPLAADTFIAGSGSVDLWVHAGAATDTDLEVTVSEVRADGTEIYVQSGWLRASQRALDAAASSELRPVHTHRRTDAAALPPNEFVEARVEVFPFAHPFRAGSRLRLTIDAPGNNRAVWAFETISAGETVTIAHDAAHPSALVLSVIPSVTLPGAPPACGSIRLQPCRPYTPTATGG